MVFSAASASAQVYTTPDYGYAEPVADLAAPADGYAAAPPPAYTAPPVYAAPVYTPPTVYVVPAPVYAAPSITQRPWFRSQYMPTPRGIGGLRAWVARRRPPVWVALSDLAAPEAGPLSFYAFPSTANSRNNRFAMNSAGEPPSWVVFSPVGVFTVTSPSRESAYDPTIVRPRNLIWTSLQIIKSLSAISDVIVEAAPGVHPARARP